MAGQDAGGVGIEVVPKIDSAAWGQQIQARLDQPVNRAGRALGRTLAEGMKAGFAPRRLEEAMRDASPRLQVAGGRLGRQIGAEIARATKAELEAKLRNLPRANVKVRVELDEPSLQRVRRRIESLGPFTATINVDADTAAAMARLLALRAEADRLFGRSVNVTVGANTAQAASALTMLGLQMAALASIPIGATIAAGLGGIAASAVAAGAGFGGLLAVAIPGVNRIREALQAQKTAQNQVTTATQAGTVALNVSAIAAAQAQLRAMAMAQAERQVTNAQRAARQAQVDLNEARRQGARSLQDLRNSVVDAGLSLRGDELAVLRAKQALDALNASREDALAVQRAQLDLAKANTTLKAVLADPKSTQLQKDQAKLAVDAAKEALRQAQEQRRARELERREAKLAYEQAVQQLKQQQLAYRRLRQDEARARREGVEGSEEVRAAKERLRSALQQVADAQRAVRQQQIQDRIAALQAADAQRQAAAAADGTSAANVRLGRAMDKLTPAQTELLKGWQTFSKVYRDWTRSLEPDVLPVLAGGLALTAGQLGKFSPMIRSSSAAFLILEARASAALDGPFWTKFINNVGIAAPEAILELGSIGGNVFTGLGGVINAFLPYTGQLLGAVDDLTDGFADWGTELGGSTGFIVFMDYAARTGPQVVSVIGAVASAFFQVGQALAPLAGVQLGVIRFLAEGIADLASSHPQLFQLAAAVFLVNRALRILGFTSLIAGLTGSGVAAGVAGAGMLRFGMILRTVGGAMMGVTGQAVTTRIALLGLAKGAGLLLAFYAATQAIDHYTGSADRAKPSTDALRQALIELGRTGQSSNDLLKQFAGDGIGSMVEQARQLADPTTSQKATQFFSGLINGLYGANGIAQQARENFKGVDQTLVQMVQGGNAAAAKAAFDRLRDSLVGAGLGVNQVNSLFPRFTQLMYSGSGTAALFTQQIERQNRALSANARAFASDQQQVIDFNQALNAGRNALDTNGRAFWGNSQAATNNRSAILNGARVVQNYTDDLVSNNRVTDASIRRIKDQREQLIQMAQKFGLSRKAAERYVDQLVKIPKKTSTNVSVSAKGKFDMSGLGNLGPLSDVLRGVFGNAGGGYIPGGGGPRDDGYLTRISAGEMVINAPAVARHKPLLASINDEGNQGTIYKGTGYSRVGAFAGGGIAASAQLALPAPPSRSELTMGPPPVIPGFAGGGIPKEILAPSYRKGYSYDGEAARTLDKARKANLAYLAGTFGYVGGQTAVMATVLQQLLQGGYGSGAKAVAFARAQLGEPYVWGAEGPSTWDCSGLTQAAWRHAGVNIPRVTYDQIAYGTASSRSRAMPGDLLFPHRGHVMMVTGMGGSKALIHAPRTGDVVRYAPWRDGVVRHIAGKGGSYYGGGSPKAFAKSQFDDMGWGAGQWPPLDRLWQRESGWRWNARNPSSGAYGIPQALPPDKMASFGADWKTNWATQIRWGLSYIASRYGTPARAWSHSQYTGWYADGTKSARRGLAWVGERGPELVDFRGGERVWPHEESLRIAAAAGAAPIELLEVPEGGGETHMHAHFDGWTRAGVQAEVVTAFHALQVQAAAAQRVGRRR
ncbi:NlpC/P60 family protein [Spirillospora sp. CA-294931]|uniref:aggregation-promoting factor C-terminal-like domain-containing protein n=1 Tax=Spirillospora sp. CA-294931 TaxID=3240042 RepID=UPI003D94C452